MVGGNYEYRITNHLQEALNITKNPQTVETSTTNKRHVDTDELIILIT